MAKTRRKKINRSPKGLGGNVDLAVVENGILIKTTGFRAEGGTKGAKAGADARPVFIGRTYTGKPRGKAYPYAGAKRGGGNAPAT